MRYKFLSSCLPSHWLQLPFWQKKYFCQKLVLWCGNVFLTHTRPTHQVWTIFIFINVAPNFLRGGLVYIRGDQTSEKKKSRFGWIWCVAGSFSILALLKTLRSYTSVLYRWKPTGCTNTQVGLSGCVFNFFFLVCESVLTYTNGMIGLVKSLNWFQLLFLKKMMLKWLSVSKIDLSLWCLRAQCWSLLKA